MSRKCRNATDRIGGETAILRQQSRHSVRLADHPRTGLTVITRAFWRSDRFSVCVPRRTHKGTRTFQSVFLPATATSVTFTVANDDEGVTAGADPDVGPVCGAATCELLSRTTVTVPELATATRPVSVSRLRRINSARISFAP